MRIISQHRAALDRQIQESVNIEVAMKNEMECLNLKSEWSTSKIPGMSVNNPAGLSRNPERRKLRLTKRDDDSNEDHQKNIDSMELYDKLVQKGVKRFRREESDKDKVESELEK